ncbi:MAG: arylamine N-acetyltransferase [Bacteroidota bacterium]|nr:arylamine N-acetyltransferase [Bacteroidota bacterium]
MFIVDEYLKRLQISKVLTPNLEFLNQLHFAHLINIPYENFDIINKVPFSLDEDCLFEKIILNNRGGYCYELIILFKRLLSELGYNTDLLSARIFHQPGQILGPEYDHSILIVTLESKWLTDPGNSLWFSQPIKLDYTKSQTRNFQTFKISQSDTGIYTMSEKKSGEQTFLPQYCFSLIPGKTRNSLKCANINGHLPNQNLLRSIFVLGQFETEGSL